MENRRKFEKMLSQVAVGLKASLDMPTQDDLNGRAHARTQFICGKFYFNTSIFPGCYLTNEPLQVFIDVPRALMEIDSFYCTSCQDTLRQCSSCSNRNSALWPANDLGKGHSS